MLGWKRMTIAIPLTVKERAHIRRRAARAGLSFEEFTRRALATYEPDQETDSLENYTNAAALKRSLRQAKADYKAGRYSTTV